MPQRARLLAPQCRPDDGSTLRRPPPWPADPAREDALNELHALLLRAARFELSRRRGQLPEVGAAELDQLAVQAADAAQRAVLKGLDSGRDTRRFSTWASKYALREAGVAAQRRAWRDRKLVLDERPDTPVDLHRALRCALTDHERPVFVALMLNEVPIDVLAERWSTTRGALYQSLHNARGKLRTSLANAASTRS